MFEKEQIETLLAQSLSRGGNFAEIFFEDSWATRITFEDGKPKDVSIGPTLGWNLKIENRDLILRHCSNDFDFGKVVRKVKTLIQNINKTRKVIPEDLKYERAPIYSPIKIEPKEVSLKEKIGILKRANQAGRNFNPLVKQIKIRYSDQTRKILVANSSGIFREDNQTITTIAITVFCEKDGKLHQGYAAWSQTRGFEFFEEFSPEELAEKAARRAILQIEARPAAAGQYPVVLSSAAGGTMIHEAIGHGLERDLIEKGASVYSRPDGKGGYEPKFEEQVASFLITVVDDRTIPFSRGTAGIDDEGNFTEKRMLIDRGILVGILADRKTPWLHPGAQPAGHGRRMSYQWPAIPRMGNTFIEPGKIPAENLIKALDKGIYIVQMTGGQVNVATGDFVFGCEESYWVENGEIKYPLRGIGLIGNGPKVLQLITMVGNDFDWGVGTCGKDGQGVPVADGQPSLLIPLITIGGTEVK